MKKETVLYVILKHRNIKIKVKEVLEGEKYKLIDGDIVTKQEIKEFISQLPTTKVVGLSKTNQ